MACYFWRFLDYTLGRIKKDWSVAILLLSMLGMLGLAFVFDTDDAVAEEDTIVDEENPAGEDIVTGLALNGNIVTATEGDDVVTGDMLFEGFDGPDDGVSTINLFGGDDSYSSGPTAEMNIIINGCDHNDTISLGSDIGIASGDAGDDVLFGGLGSQLHGGAGDDVLTYNTYDSSGDFGNSRASGGAGVDTIQVEHALGWHNSYDTTSTFVTGGDGADSFLLELVDQVETTDDGFDGTLGQTGFDIAQVYIEDFTPGVDVIEIDISSFTDGGNYELVDVNLEEDPRLFHFPEEDNNWYGLTLSLLAEGRTEPFDAVVHFRSAGGEVTLADITILSGLAA